jgi:hypothetical protein
VKSEATEASSSGGGGSVMHSTEPAGTPFQALGEGSNCQNSNRHKSNCRKSNCQLCNAYLLNTATTIICKHCCGS